MSPVSKLTLGYIRKLYTEKEDGFCKEAAAWFRDEPPQTSLDQLHQICPFASWEIKVADFLNVNQDPWAPAAYLAADRACKSYLFVALVSKGDYNSARTLWDLSASFGATRLREILNRFPNTSECCIHDIRQVCSYLIDGRYFAAMARVRRIAQRSADGRQAYQFEDSLQMQDIRETLGNLSGIEYVDG